MRRWRPAALHHPASGARTAPAQGGSGCRPPRRRLRPAVHDHPARSAATSSSPFGCLGRHQPSDQLTFTQHRSSDVRRSPAPTHQSPAQRLVVMAQPLPSLVDSDDDSWSRPACSVLAARRPALPPILHPLLDPRWTAGATRPMVPRRSSRSLPRACTVKSLHANRSWDRFDHVICVEVLLTQGAAVRLPKRPAHRRTHRDRKRADLAASAHRAR